MTSPNLQENRFLQFMVQQVDETAYLDWKKRVGQPNALPDEIVGVGTAHFVAYFNTECPKRTCIYDLSLIEEIYHDEGYDSTDDFHQEARFSCVYCDQVIKFASFFTGEELNKDVETAFQKMNDQNTSHSSIKRRNSSKMTSSKKRPESLARLNLKLRPLGESTEFMPIEEVPSPAMSYNFPWGQNDTIENLLAKELPLLKEFNYDDVTTKSSLYTGVALGSGRVRDSLNGSQEGRGGSNSSMTQIATGSKLSRFVIQERSSHILGDCVDNLPTRSEILQVLASSKLNPVVRISRETLLLSYWFWKIRILKDTSKLISLWFVDIVQTIGEFGERVKEYKLRDTILDSDPRMLLTYLQFDKITFCCVEDSRPLFVEYVVANNEVRYVNPVFSYIDKQVKGPLFEERKELAFEMFEELNKSYLGGQTISTKSSVDIHVNGDATSFVNSYCIQEYYNFQDKVHRSKVPESVEKKANILTKWVILDTKVLVPVEIDPDFKARTNKRRQALATMKDPNEPSFLEDSDELVTHNQSNLGESRISDIEKLQEAPDSPSKQSILEVAETGSASNLQKEPQKEISAFKPSKFSLKQDVPVPLKPAEVPRLQPLAKKKATFQRGASLDSFAPDKSEEERQREKSIESLIGLLKFYKSFDKGRYDYLKERSEQKFGKYLIQNLLVSSGAALSKPKIKSILKISKPNGSEGVQFGPNHNIGQKFVETGQGKYSLPQSFLVKNKKNGIPKTDETSVSANPFQSGFQPRILKTGMFSNKVPLPWEHPGGLNHSNTPIRDRSPAPQYEKRVAVDKRETRASSRASSGSRDRHKTSSKDSASLPQIPRGRSHDRNNDRVRDVAGRRERLPPLSLENLHLGGRSSESSL